MSFGDFLRNDYIRGFGREIRDGLSFYFFKKKHIKIVRPKNEKCECVFKAPAILGELLNSENIFSKLPCILHSFGSVSVVISHLNQDLQH